VELNPCCKAAHMLSPDYMGSLSSTHFLDHSGQCNYRDVVLLPELLCDRGDFVGRPRAQLLSPIESEESTLGISRLNDTVAQKGDRLSLGDYDLTVVVDRFRGYEDWNIAKLLRRGGDVAADSKTSDNRHLPTIDSAHFRRGLKRIGSSRYPGISHIRNPFVFPGTWARHSPECLGWATAQPSSASSL
jgi:hypothetical protein